MNSDTAAPDGKRRKTPLIVGGVPEHFNLPWHLARERGLFEKHGVEVQFEDMKLGTGAMVAAAKDGTLDVIIALTEGLVKDIAAGSELRLLGTYVGSPLCWAISTGVDSKIKRVEDLRNGTFGVSRMGSGSHLMAYVLAIQRGWDPKTEVHFEIKGNITQLCEGVNDGSTDAFMWETFTTKPYHDDGVVRRVGDITTPWPCFMLAARKGIVDEKLDQIQRALAAVHEAALQFHSEEATMPAVVSERYGIKPEDAKAWYDGVHISAERFISQAGLEQAVEILKVCGQLKQDKQYNVADLIEPRLAELKRDMRDMKLYDRSELVVALHKRLTAANLHTGPISYTDLLPYDQHHYRGVAAVEDVISACRITQSSRVVNIGSGLGGPSRLMAGRTGCQVLACEIQEDLNRTATELTERCGLDRQVHHVGGNFMKIVQHLQRGGYDTIVSWLTVLHFEDRNALFKQCYEILKPGGIFFAADFVALAALTAGEVKTLHDEVGCAPLTSSIEAYKVELQQAGFKIIEAKDVTEDWRAITAERAVNFARDEKAQVAVIGQQVFDSLKRFYNVVSTLFAGGNLGGLEVYAQKPLGW